MPGYTAVFAGVPGKIFIYLSCFIFTVTIGCIPRVGTPREQARMTYYVRYDTFMHNNRSVRENLVMVPAYEEFRIKKFASVQIPCTLPLPRSFEKKELHSLALESAIKGVLETSGLMYVSTLNTVTVVSYEGLVQGPFRIKPGQPAQGPHDSSPSHGPSVFSCSARFAFSPLSFPDQWARQRHIKKIKQKIFDIWEGLR